MKDIKKPVSVGLTGKQRAILEQIAERFGTSKSVVVATLLETYAVKILKEDK